MKNAIQACWITNESIDSYCEYCPSRGLKTYLAFDKTVLNPAHICEYCVKEYNVVGWFDSKIDYYKELSKLKE